ncbi:SdrH family protein [Staphylococcus intermedius]|uniref:SdrH family protein n=1 Tax=Staphylococcus intermedius TaxID=1285 RepID=UPI000BBB83B4|nr:SdrH family protein [Staphylococcus intermedius]PCF63158.1 hypothetical protein B5C04_10580 [Staphylococcus intermedius]
MVEHQKEHRVKRLFKIGLGSTSILYVVSPLLLSHEVVQAAEVNEVPTTLNTMTVTSYYEQIDERRSVITSDRHVAETPTFTPTKITADEIEDKPTENVKPDDDELTTDESESTLPSTEHHPSNEQPGTEEVPSHKENEHNNDSSQANQPSQPDQSETQKDEDQVVKPEKDEHKKPNQSQEDQPSKNPNTKPNKPDKPALPPKEPNRPNQKDDHSNNTPPPATDNGGHGNGGEMTESNGGGGHEGSPQKNEHLSNGNDGQVQQNGTVESSNQPNHYGSSAYDAYAGLLNNNYKYNPLFKEEVARLSEFGNQVPQDIKNLSRKEQFKQNEFLDDLQRSTDYFRYQYFNPLSTEQYYHRLDKQVLALVTGEFGSMPDFKKNGDKSRVNKHQQDKVKKIEQHGENFNTHHMKDMKEDTGKSLSYKPMIYIGVVMVGFVGLISMILWKRLHHYWK